MNSSSKHQNQEKISTSVKFGVFFGAAFLLVLVILYRTGGAENNDPSVANDQFVAGTIEELRAAAENVSDDAAPWQRLGFAHFQRGEFSEASSAYERAVTIEPSEAVLWSALGEARVMASDRDPMPADAVDAFVKANEIDPKDPRSRYFLSVKLDLEGDHQAALDGWFSLLADTPVGAPWEVDLIRTIQQVGAINSFDVEPRLELVLAARPGLNTSNPRGTRGPTQAEIAAAGSIPPSEQREMAIGMVESLEQRLANEPNNVQGWIMLIRSRMTLGQANLASDALQSAITANPSSAGRLRDEATRLGVP